MTETTATPGPTTRPRPLYRDPDEAMFAGVCTAVARYTDTDPVIWRIVVAVLAVFGGTGVVLYLLGWLLIPKIGEDASVAERWLHREHLMTPVTVTVVAVASVVLFAGLDDGDGVAAVAVLALVAFLVHRERQGRPPAPPYVPPAWPPPPPVVRTPRERSRLGAVTLSVAALVSGLLVLARTYGADGLTPSRIVAAALLVVGSGLVVGTWYGRARWLTFAGLLLTLALAGTAATDATTGALRGGVGDRTWLAAPGLPTQSFRLGIGEATLDLTTLPVEGRHLDVTAHVGAGHLIVLVPDDVPIRVHSTVRLGEITEFGESTGNGIDRVEHTRSYGPGGDPRVEVDVTVAAGQVEVRHG